MVPGTNTNDAHFRLVAGVLVGIIVAVGFLAAAEYVVDPRAEHGTQWLEPIIGDYAAYKMALYDDLPEPPAVVVVGSSRSYTLPTDAITESTSLPAFNWALGRTSPQDHATIVDFLLAQPDPPQRILFSLDLDAVTNPHFGGVLSESTAAHRYGLTPTSPTVLQSIENVFDADRLTDTVKTLQNAHLEKPKSHRFDDRGNAVFAGFDKRYEPGREPDPAERETGRLMMTRAFDEYGGKHQPTVDLIAELAGKVTQAGIRIDFHITPLHPDADHVLWKLEGARETFDSLQFALRPLCGALLGFHLPGPSVFTQEGLKGWRDGTHMHYANGRTYTQALLGGTYDTCITNHSPFIEANEGFTVESTHGPATTRFKEWELRAEIVPGNNATSADGYIGITWRTRDLLVYEHSQRFDNGSAIDWSIQRDGDNMNVFVEDNLIGTIYGDYWRMPLAIELTGNAAGTNRATATLGDIAGQSIGPFATGKSTAAQQRHLITWTTDPPDFLSGTWTLDWSTPPGTPLKASLNG